MENTSAPRALYVGNLPKDLEEPENTLMNIFSKVGMILSIKLCRDINTHNSLGYAYVNFQNPADAERAQQQLNYSEIPGKAGRELRVLWSSRDPTVRKRGAGNVFIKNLDPEMTNKQLHELCAQYGTVLSAAQSTDDKGTRLGYGHVHFQNEEAANAAVAALDQKDVNGHVLTVNLFVRKVEREKEEEKTFKKIYIKNLSTEATEESVKKLLSKFGTVSSVFITGHPKFATKFALADMSAHEEAVAVIEKLNGQKNEFTAPDASLFVCRCRKKADRKPTHSDVYQNEGRNLYIKYLPDDMTEERLRGDFSGFGEIESMSLQKTPEGLFRGVAFVCYKTKESADAAVRNLHEKMLYDSRRLYVALAQRRDARLKLMQDHQRIIQNQAPRMYPQMMMPWGMQRQWGAPNAMNMMGPMSGMPMMRRGPNRPMHPAIRPHPNAAMRPRQVYTNPQQPRSEGISATMLANMSPEERKNALGERLYAQIVHIDQQQAAKITGMLLEMDNSEILSVLDDQALLRSKVDEAQQVLRQHEAGAH
eukprot:GILI01002315.1.p1 GENE.GILI01002315.1~~GILI01002315.1.p1  ORF type:complete len:535 (+),score=140.40 GILI01002315.1:33-1637(+)